MFGRAARFASAMRSVANMFGRVATFARPIANRDGVDGHVSDANADAAGCGMEHNPLKCIMFAASVNHGMARGARTFLIHYLFRHVIFHAASHASANCLLGMIMAVTPDGDGLIDLTEPVSSVSRLVEHRSIFHALADGSAHALAETKTTLAVLEAAARVRLIDIRDFRHSLVPCLQSHAFLPTSSLLPIIAFYSLPPLHNPAILTSDF
jgi:hypothetical protein